MKEKILNLRDSGMTYKQIVNELGCAKSTVAYYCNPLVREKAIIRQRGGKSPLSNRISAFKRRRVGDGTGKPNGPINVSIEYSIKDVLQSFGETPICYLTGIEIDLLDLNSWTLDHVIPVSKGGTNELENLKLTTKSANQAKSNMTPEEFIKLCKMVVDYNLAG